MRAEPPSRRLGALARVAALRLDGAERRRSLAQQREAEAERVLREVEAVLEAYTIRLPTLRQKTYREHAKAQMTHGGVQILLDALRGLDEAIAPMTADIEAARSELDTRRRALAKAEATYRHHERAKRRREKLLARLAEEEAAMAEYLEDLKFEEWTRPCLD
ncbi:MAG: YscO family type III secretion system apparatus protein [Pseudomonadota bacterium]